ncbi:MAG: hypothetical protein GF311_23340 [Candidatus Lokiarchaeota archaeon]|nr:hypothetical protein [Candidatus Lokiarchaeota archaeon]
MTEEYKINWKKCNKCGYKQYNSHLRCLKCKNGSFTSLKTSGLGKLLSYTILIAPPMEFRDKDYYALGVVEFENGVRSLGQLTTTENLEVGMNVKPIYMKICDNLNGKEIYGYKYKPT